LGLRKIASGRATWIARIRPPEGAAISTSTSIGAVTRDFDYEGAQQAAVEWFHPRRRGNCSANCRSSWIQEALAKLQGKDELVARR